jgi:hypothetical protein
VKNIKTDGDFEDHLIEYKTHLKEKASFFIPANIENVVSRYGNRELYNRQFDHRNMGASIEDTCIAMVI